MNRAPLRFLSIAVALGAVLAMGACSKTGAGGGAAADGLSAEGYAMGSAKAPVTVIEFGSLTCPHCARWEDEVFPAFKTKYIDTGKVRYIFKETLIHPELDAAGSLLTHCVDPAKYLATVQAIFHAQPQIFPPQNDMRGALISVAHAQGMSDEKFTACMNDSKALEAVSKRQTDLDNTYHVQSTPTFIVNGKVYDSGEMPIDALSKAIDPLLAGK